MPHDWDVSFFDPSTDVLPGNVPDPPSVPVFSLAKCIKNKADRSFLDERAAQTARAIAKLRRFIELAGDCSSLTKQVLDEGTEDGQEQVLLSIIGTRSPGTVVKGTNALFHYYRWRSVSFSDECFPLEEPKVWSYMRHLQTSNAAPTKAQSFLQALRFAKFVLQLEGVDDCVVSRRLQGISELQLAGKRPTRQARPLTVLEVKKLHGIMSDEKKDLQQRVLASHLLLMLYSRSRTPDLAHVHEILHDSRPDVEGHSHPGYMQINTKFHKSARNVETKNLLLPILVSAAGVVDDDWMVAWMKLRKRAGLKVAGEFQMAVQPAPDVKFSGGWLSRPLSCSETTVVLRSLVESEDANLTSHALKVTGLSWAAKAELSREHRRLLGRHASSFKDSDSIYARDLGFAPVRAFEKVIYMIQAGTFQPDQGRSMYFVGENKAVPGTPLPCFQPTTPAFLGRATAVRQPTVIIEESDEEVKAEPFDEAHDWSGRFEDWNFVEDPQPIPGNVASEPFQIEQEGHDSLSVSDSTSSPSCAADADSEQERPAEMSDDEPPPISMALTDAFVKNKKTGVIHSIPDKACDFGVSTYENSEVMQKLTTKCGRLTQKGFVFVEKIDDWTSKCRVCFRGCRDPFARSRRAWKKWRAFCSCAVMSILTLMWVVVVLWC